MFGVAVRVYDDLAEYMKDNKLRRSPAGLDSAGPIEMWFSHKFYQCYDCANLYGGLERSAYDRNGHVDKRKARSKCPRCGGRGRAINELREDITKLDCPNCRSQGLVVEELGLWD